MAKVIRIHKVPEKLHRKLKARAASAGISLSDYLLGEIKEIAAKPTLGEFRERLHRRRPVTVELDIARLLREERGN